jgi:flavin-dependent thymidylate synthase
MKVTLINHTEDALATLLYTKSTRLTNDQTIEDVKRWPHEKQMEELAYMLDTIKSSWEFVDYVFLIEDVTRAFTHQLVRTRTGSYAQQAQRVVDVRDIGYLVPEFKDGDGFHDDGLTDEFIKGMNATYESYGRMIDDGAPVQDARGIIPTNTYTKIIVKFNLRTMHDTAKLRLCTRTQGEYQNVFKMMRNEVIEVHPWAEDFIKVACAENGICAFPRYDKCPIQKFCYNNTQSRPVHEGIVSTVQSVWEETEHEMNPVAVNGKTM